MHFVACTGIRSTDLRRIPPIKAAKSTRTKTLIFHGKAATERNSVQLIERKRVVRTPIDRRSRRSAFLRRSQPRCKRFLGLLRGLRFTLLQDLRSRRTVLVDLALSFERSLVLSREGAFIVRMIEIKLILHASRLRSSRSRHATNVSTRQGKWSFLAKLCGGEWLGFVEMAERLGSLRISSVWTTCSHRKLMLVSGWCLHENGEAGQPDPTG